MLKSRTFVARLFIFTHSYCILIVACAVRISSFQGDRNMDTVRLFLNAFIGALFALCAMPAFASNHTGIDPLEHLQIHLEQAKFWIGQGEWVMAFSQPVCSSELTWQTALTHWMFVQGGGLIVIASICLATLFLLVRKIMKPFERSMKFLPKHHTSFT